MKRKIWIFNHYAAQMYFNKGGRHYWFAKFLKRNGYEPVIFACNTKHGVPEKFIDTNQLWKELISEDIGVPFVFVKARTYSENGKQRIFNMLDFYHNVKKTAKEYAETHGKPDIILASSVHPLTLVAGIQLAKHFGVKCICEMRDLWPEAIVAYSKKLKKTNPLVKLLYQGEKWIYKKADALIFTQEGGPDYVREQGWDKEHGGPIDMSKAFHINNGVDLEAFEYNKEHFWYEDQDMDSDELYKVVYAGAIRRVNNLGIIVDAAKFVQNPKIKFIIFGDGDELESLKERVKKENVTNVIFKGRINKQYIPSVLCRADLNLVHWEMNPLLRVGESYNKSFEYFAAGKPVFYTIKPNYSIVEKYHCGKLTEECEPKSIADGIGNMAKMSAEEISQMSHNAHIAAINCDFSALTEKLVDVIEQI